MSKQEPSSSSQTEKTYKLEAPLTKKVKDWLLIQPDIMYYKASDRYNKGVSDIIACVGGVFVAIELKADYNSMSTHQRLFISNTIKAGGVGGSCKTLDEAKRLVEAARKKAAKLR